MTILKTQNAVINGKTKKVQTVANNGRQQDIYYLVNGKRFGFDSFWELSPVFKG